MADTQYDLFRDLDRHCVAGGVQEQECLEAVRRKRECIECELNRMNPIARDVLAGRTTFTAIYNDYSRQFRGVRRFLPMQHADAHNDRLEHFARIVPNVQHFVRRSVFATDNPITCCVYGLIAAIAIALIWTHAVRNDDTAGVDRATVSALVVTCSGLGFFAGLFAMFRYRTRDPHRIHAREAAAYMDLNYSCHRSFDDEAWARFMAAKTTPPTAAPPPAAAAATSAVTRSPGRS